VRERESGGKAEYEREYTEGVGLLHIEMQMTGNRCQNVFDRLPHVTICNNSVSPSESSFKGALFRLPFDARPLCECLASNSIIFT
jgi:hypothetical protein